MASIDKIISNVRDVEEIADQLLLPDIFRAIEQLFRIRVLYNETARLTADKAQIAEKTDYPNIFIITAAKLDKDDPEFLRKQTIKLFTVAHELGHACLHRNVVTRVGSKESELHDIEASIFASMLLSNRRLVSAHVARTLLSMSLKKANEEECIKALSKLSVDDFK